MKAFIKAFEARQGSVKIKIEVNFLFQYNFLKCTGRVKYETPIHRSLAKKARNVLNMILQLLNYAFKSPPKKKFAILHLKTRPDTPGNSKLRRAANRVTVSFRLPIETPLVARLELFKQSAY